jgi:DNA invertase Pin-like site-specific DNA recombinase
VNKRVAIYLRVSKNDGSQKTENQRPDCERVAALYGDVVRVYEDQISAVAERPAYESMMADARAGAFDVLVIWALDRFGRSMFGIINDTRELAKLDIGVVSVKDTWLNTEGPLRELLIAIFGWVAQQERARLIERTNAGIQRAREEGKHIGRPAAEVDVGRAKALMALGATQDEAAQLCGVGRSSLRRALRAA